MKEIFLFAFPKIGGEVSRSVGGEVTEVRATFVLPGLWIASENLYQMDTTEKVT